MVFPTSHLSFLSKLLRTSILVPQTTSYQTPSFSIVPLSFPSNPFSQRPYLSNMSPCIGLAHHSLSCLSFILPSLSRLSALTHTLHATHSPCHLYSHPPILEFLPLPIVMHHVLNKVREVCQIAPRDRCGSGGSGGGGGGSCGGASVKGA